MISIPIAAVLSGCWSGRYRRRWSPGREVSEGVGNSVEEGAISAKRGATGRAISSFTCGCLTSSKASTDFYQVQMLNSKSARDVKSHVHRQAVLSGPIRWFTAARKYICSSLSHILKDYLEFHRHDISIINDALLSIIDVGP